MTIPKTPSRFFSRDRAFARLVIIYGIALPFFNAVSALALGLLVVYSDADRHKVLTGFLCACNVGGWLWWLMGSFRAVRLGIQRWVKTGQQQNSAHPGFRLANLLSAGGALSWISVLGLLAYGMLG
ncbi:MAG TPA: hypothetical protein VEF04_14145 [Blastocatellia bacterium]|nr:hypothetical protein [Blastocatellia bacterium]